MYEFIYTRSKKTKISSVLDARGSRRDLALSDKCGAIPNPTCTDGIQNGNETGVDCVGLSCAPCQTACTDNEGILSITFDNYADKLHRPLKMIQEQPLLLLVIRLLILMDLQ